MSEAAKRLEKAEKYIQRGKPDSALRECLEALREEPGHEAASQAAADLYVSLGHRVEAQALLSDLFNRQVMTGQANATVTYKKLAKIGAPSAAQSLAVAPLLAKSSHRDALDAYHTALRGFVDANRKAEAMAALEGILALHPTIDTYRHVGKVARDLGETVAAITALTKAGKLARAEGDVTTALECYQQVLELAPGDRQATVEYVNLLLERPNLTAADGERVYAMIEPLAQGPESTAESRAASGRALLVAGRVRDAVPFLKDAFDVDPNQIGVVIQAVGALLQARQAAEAVEVARTVERYLRRAGRLREFIPAMRELGEKQSGHIEFLEYLVELFNASNREHDYCRTLLRLFELYYAVGNFLRAGECLDRAAEVDPYEPGYPQRLAMLQGKLDPNRLKVIAARFTGALTTDEAPAGLAAPARSESEPTVLEDLMLQAEIFLQYSLRARAVERLERIRKLFPGEELKNDKLRELYLTAGLTPASSPPAVEALPTSSPQAAADETGVDNVARVSEITRNIYRQGSVKSVLFTAVNEAGRHWNASRCISVLCAPGKPPSIALEYCAPGIKPSDVRDIVKLVGILQPLAIVHGPLTIAEGAASPFAAGLRPFADSMGISSLLAMPLVEGEEHIGLLVLAQVGARRNWRPADTTLVNTIAEQIVQAVANARLRSLVKNLAVTEEKSGLLKRTSYLDMLLSEVKRTLQQHSTVTVVLMQFGKPQELVREMGEAAVEAMMQQIGQLVCSHIRQNDLAVRYDVAAVALVLADTTEKSALLASEKLRKVISNVRTPALAVGIAEAFMQADYDPVDIVTEVINRADAALQAALAEGANSTRAVPAANGAAIAAR